MKLLIVTPAGPRSRKGNRITALRWARLLRELGHRVAVAEQFDNQRCDALIALHARRSADSVVRFAREHPGRPLILALTGTDLYRDIRHSAAAARSLKLARRLVLLQPHGLGKLPPELRIKARVIYQSVERPRHLPDRRADGFDVAVVGHLRPVKDPFRAAMAARRLPRSSKVRIVHCGAALSPEMEVRAQQEMERNPRYHWLGDLPRWRMLRRLARCRLLALSSRMEGGANVISEAVAVGVPVLSSRISGSIGLLGEDYPGYFDVGDTAGLARLLQRAEADESFYQTLAADCDRLAPLFDPARERESWRNLLAEF